MQKWTSLLGRIFLSVVFIRFGIGKIFDPVGTQQYMESGGVPSWFLIPTIVVLLVGGLSVLVAYKARYGVLLLVGFLIPSTLIFHNFFADPSQETAFMKNLGLMGGLLMVSAFCPWGISFDEKNIYSD